MKATIEFNLPDDEDDLHHAMNGEFYFTALHNIKSDVRQIWKYRELQPEIYEVVDEIYQIIIQRMNQCKAND